MVRAFSNPIGFTRIHAYRCITTLSHQHSFGTAMAASIEVVHAYRNLYRSLLQAVQYAFPARLIARNQLRTAFREPGAVFNKEGIRRTVWFLQCAARERGMEHIILKNLLKVQQRRGFSKKGWRKSFHDSKTQ